MAIRSLVRSGGILLAGVSVMAAAGCGGGDDEGGKQQDPVFTLPTSPSPSGTGGASEAPDDPGTEPGLKGARAALTAFLKGQSAGDPSVCRYVAADGPFVRGPALEGDCKQGIRNTPHYVKPLERQAMRTVRVTGGRISDDGTEVTIPFSALDWRTGHMTVSTLQSTYVLRRTGDTWQIVR